MLAHLFWRFGNLLLVFASVLTSPFVSLPERFLRYLCFCYFLFKASFAFFLKGGCIMKKVLPFVLIFTLLLSMYTVPARAVVTDTSTIVTMILPTFFNSVGVPLNFTSSAAATSASTSLVAGAAASEGISASALETTIAAGSRIVGGKLILTAAAAAVLYGIARYVNQTYFSDNGIPSADTEIIRNNYGIGYYNQPSLDSVPFRVISISSWIPISNNMSVGQVLGSFNGNPVTYAGNGRVRFIHNISGYSTYQYIDIPHFSYYAQYEPGKYIYDRILLGIDLGSSDFPANRYCLLAHMLSTNPSSVIPSFYRLSYNWYTVPTGDNYRQIGGDNSFTNTGNGITYVKSSSISPNSDIQFIPNTPVEIPETKTLEISLPEGISFPTSDVDVSDWIYQNFNYSDPVLDPTNLPNKLADPSPGPNPPNPPYLGNPDWDPPKSEGTDTPSPDDPTTGFILPSGFFVGPWHYVTETIQNSAAFVAALVAALSSLLPGSLWSLIWCAVVLALVFSLIRRLIE